MTWVDRSDGLVAQVNRWWLTSTVGIADVAVAYQPIGAANVANSYINLNNPGTNNASPVVAPTFATATGWAFTGTQHLTTNITGTGNRTVIVRTTSDTTNLTRQSITGYDTGSKAFYIEKDTTFPVLDWHIEYNTTADTDIDEIIADYVVCLARNKFYVDGVLFLTTGTLDTWSEGTITIANTIVAANRYDGDISAYAIYNRELTAAEVVEITTNMQDLTSSDQPDPTANVNYITQKPSTKRLNSTSHELLAALDTGLFHTINGGRFWNSITLPDPSNAEFGDSPAATVDELAFHYVEYSRTSESVVFLLAEKLSVNRQWLYKSSDDLVTWSSRGIITI